MYDYVIIGGGSSGCVTAARLGEIAEARILLLEAGPADSSADIHRPVGFYKMTTGPLTWGYETAPSPQRDGHVMPLAQARVLGGGSSINAMVFTRGNPADYDEWETEEGCAGWSFQDVLPYFRRSEANNRLADEYHGTEGPLGASDLVSPHPLSRAFVLAAQQAGLAYNPDFNGAEQAGCGLYQVTQRDARRCSAAVAYLHPAIKRGNVDVVTDALATRVVVENGRSNLEKIETLDKMRQRRIHNSPPANPLNRKEFRLKAPALSKLPNHRANRSENCMEPAAGRLGACAWRPSESSG